jgi:hypothetical protein
VPALLSDGVNSNPNLDMNNPATMPRDQEEVKI